MYCHGDNLGSWGNYFSSVCHDIRLKNLEVSSISICWHDSPHICNYISCRVGSESLIPGMMWCRRCRLCCSELIGQRTFLTQLMDLWPLEQRRLFLCLMRLLRNNFDNITPKTSQCSKGSLKIAFYFCFFLKFLNSFFEKSIPCIFSFIFNCNLCEVY